MMAWHAATLGANAMKLPRRTLLRLTAGAAALPAVSRFARAQTYPARPVRLLVGPSQLIDVPSGAGATTGLRIGSENCRRGSGP